MGNDRLSPPVKPQPDNFDPDSALASVTKAAYYGIRSAVHTYGEVIAGSRDPKQMVGCVWRDPEFVKAYTNVQEYAKKRPAWDNPAHVAVRAVPVVNNALDKTPPGKALVRFGDAFAHTIFTPMTHALILAKRQYDRRMGRPQSEIVSHKESDSEYNVQVNLPYHEPQTLHLNAADLGWLISAGVQVSVDNNRRTAKIQPTPEQAKLLASYAAIRSSVVGQISVLDHTITLKIAHPHSTIADDQAFSVLELQEYAEQGMVYNIKEKKFKKV